MAIVFPYDNNTLRDPVRRGGYTFLGDYGVFASELP